jgi:hypothetical protein
MDGRMILRLLKGRGMVSGLFEKKRDAIPPHPVPPQALTIGHAVIYVCQLSMMQEAISYNRKLRR